MHVGLKQFKCDVCDYSCVHRGQLKEHRELKHEGKLLKCETCSKSFSSRAGYYTHKKTHDGKLFSCDQCEYSSPRRQYLTSHKQSRHGQASFSCNLCEFTAVKKIDLTRHNENEHNIK